MCSIRYRFCARIKLCRCVLMILPPDWTGLCIMGNEHLRDWNYFHGGNCVQTESVKFLEHLCWNIGADSVR